MRISNISNTNSGRVQESLPYFYILYLSFLSPLPFQYFLLILQYVRLI